MSKYIGDVSAYAYAVSKGYTGTEEEFAELMASYAEVGQTAVDAAESALNSKTAAQTAATTATTKAGEATTAAQTATTKAEEAQTNAQTASSAATSASQSASQASGYAQTAETAKTDAQTAKTQAETARDNAVTAKTAAETAQAAAETAQGAAEDAAESVSASAAQIAANTVDIAELESTKADLSELYKAFPTDTASGAIASFSDGADNIPLKSLIVNIDPVQSGSGDPSPDNVRPISGWTEVDVEQSVVNIFDKTSTVNGYIVDTNGELRNSLNCKSTDFIPIVPNTSYYIKSEQTKGAWGAWYDKDKNYVAGISRYTASESDARKTITAPSNARYMRLTVECYADGTINGNAETFSVNYPSTDHDYHPYAGRSITIDLGQTVYGGKLDVLSGVLTVYPYYASYNGETLMGEWISDRDKYVAGATPTIGAQVANIGAQGVTVQLSANQLNSLYGVNNVWADTGDTEVEYRANTKLYIAKKIAEAISALS